MPRRMKTKEGRGGGGRGGHHTNDAVTQVRGASPILSNANTSAAQHAGGMAHFKLSVERGQETGG